jgi:hypothetical protein
MVFVVFHCFVRAFFMNFFALQKNAMAGTGRFPVYRRHFSLSVRMRGNKKADCSTYPPVVQSAIDFLLPRRIDAKLHDYLGFTTLVRTA